MSENKPRYAVGDRVTFGRQGRTGVIVKVNPGSRVRYDVKSDATGVVGRYWEIDVEMVIPTQVDPYDMARTQGAGLARFHLTQGTLLEVLRRDARSRLHGWEESRELGHGRGMSMAYWRAYLNELDAFERRRDAIQAKHERTGGPDEQELADMGRTS